MSAEYNWIIDSTAIRVALNIAAFAVWVGMAYGLLALA